MNTDNFVFSLNTNDNVINSPTLQFLSDFSKPKTIVNYYLNKMKKVTGNFKTETPRWIWVKKFNCLRTKTNSFKYNDENRNF